MLAAILRPDALAWHFGAPHVWLRPNSGRPAAARDGIRFMNTTLIVIHLLVVLALIGVVLLQRSEGGALGIGGGGGGGFMNSRGTANVLTQVRDGIYLIDVLTRATAMLAMAFFVTSLLLSILAGWRPAGPTLINPTAPTQINPQGPTILDQLQKNQPKGPQVPQSK
mgnify:CR=1 FL=1